MLDAADPHGLEPGDILVAPQTDPSWVPLFVSAAAVVVNVGAMGSHAMIVSRELGVPCVASVADATSIIPDGATITVDGNAGTVTIDALPGRELMSGRTLAGYRVLDLSQVVSGPFATMLMADQGADVIKVEPSHTLGDVTRLQAYAKGGLPAFYINNNRGKRTIAVDLQTDAGRELVLELAANADVVVQNFRPGAIDDSDSATTTCAPSTRR